MAELPPSASPKPAGPKKAPARTIWGWMGFIVLSLAGLAAAGVASILFLVAIVMALAYPNLPDISDLEDYHPKLPLRVFSSEGDLIGEFGEEHRTLTPINEIPLVMKNAILAIEDARYRLRGYGARRRRQCGPLKEPRRIHHHHAGGAQCVLVIRKNLYP